jgi:hypothetical protein
MEANYDPEGQQNLHVLIHWFQECIIIDSYSVSDYIPLTPLCQLSTGLFVHLIAARCKALNDNTNYVLNQTYTDIISTGNT